MKEEAYLFENFFNLERIGVVRWVGGRCIISKKRLTEEEREARNHVTSPHVMSRQSKNMKRGFLLHTPSGSYQENGLEKKRTRG